MAKAPAFQLYAADFYMDTASWSAAQVGAYFRLLMHEWVNGPLPHCIGKLARIAGVDPRNMQKMWSAEIAKKFTTDDAGMYVNRRLEEVRQSQKEFQEKQSVKGKKSADKRKELQATAVEPEPQPECNSSSSSSSSSLIKELKKPDGPFELPSKEVISEASELKIKDDIEKVTKQLYDEKIFVKVHAFKNLALKQKKNLRSILHTLSRCYIAKPPEPWGYCLKTIGLENLNYNERDHTKDSR